MAKETNDYRTILADLKDGIYKPVYFLMGEEPYFIDVIRDYIEHNILSEEEKSFNQEVVYASDANVSTLSVINSAKGFPMGAPYRVVIVKEAQNLRDLDNLVHYLKNPQPTTILCFAFMKKADGRKKYITDIEKSGGVLFESKPIRDNMLPSFITNLFIEKQQQIEPKAVQLMADSIGADLHKVVNEVNKLLISVPKGTPTITSEMVSQYVGISKQYNMFELKTAIINRDILKANTIVKNFAANPKQNPIIPILTLLFNTFSNLMVYYYIQDKSDGNVARELGISPYASRDYATAARNFNGWQTMRILSEIRRADAAAKGIENASANDGEILKELVFHILHDKK
ncbi:MAG: DNA polymerase III subunit delta [Paludibacteraceae bacterium]|nr:DNA polymerase III subunit delta [Paludibacteraceae bacterium]